MSDLRFERWERYFLAILTGSLVPIDPAGHQLLIDLVSNLATLAAKKAEEKEAS